MPDRGRQEQTAVCGTLCWLLSCREVIERTFVPSMGSEPEDPPLSVPRDAVYTNYLQAGSTAREIVLEFGQHHRGEMYPRIHTRLVTHPAYAEDFLRVMAEALRKCKTDTGEEPHAPGGIQ